MTISIELTPETEGFLLKELARSGMPPSKYALIAIEEKLPILKARSTETTYSLLGLEGLGAEMWRNELAGRDAQEYVSQIRDEWDRTTR